MAEVVCKAHEREEIVYGELTSDEIMETRKWIPVYEGRRFDVYPDLSSGNIAFEVVSDGEISKEPMVE